MNALTLILMMPKLLRILETVSTVAPEVGALLVSFLHDLEAHHDKLPDLLTALRADIVKELHNDPVARKWLLAQVTQLCADAA
jgi:hypothetical protein